MGGNESVKLYEETVVSLVPILVIAVIVIVIIITAAVAIARVRKKRNSYIPIVSCR